MQAGPAGLTEEERVSWTFVVVRGGSGEEFTVGLGFVKLELLSGTKRHVIHTGLLTTVAQIWCR